MATCSRWPTACSRSAWANGPHPAGVERLARAVFERGLARTVLAVPIDQDRATMHLDTICTMVDVDAVVMYPNVAHRLAAVAVRPGDGDDLVISPTEPFVEAAARAMGIDELRVIDTGLDPITAEREQWDDGNNTLAIGPKLAVAYERNVETNERLELAGIEVIRIAGSELGRAAAGRAACPARSAGTRCSRPEQGRATGGAGSGRDGLVKGRVLVIPRGAGRIRSSFRSS